MDQTKTELELLETQLLKAWREYTRLWAEVAALTSVKHDGYWGTVQQKEAAETIAAYKRAEELYSANWITFLYFLDDEAKAKGQ